MYSVDLSISGSHLIIRGARDNACRRKHGGSDIYTDSKVRGANMGPIWGRQDPGGSHVDPRNFAIWVVTSANYTSEASHRYKLNQHPAYGMDD